MRYSVCVFDSLQRTDSKVSFVWESKYNRRAFDSLKEPTDFGMKNVSNICYLQQRVVDRRCITSSSLCSIITHIFTETFPQVLRV